MVQCKNEWEVLQTDTKSLSTDPDAGNIKAKHSYFIEWKEVGHIPREISRYVYFLLKKKMVKFLIKSLKNKVPPIPSGELEVSLSMTFSCKEKWEINTVMEEFVEYFCSFEQSDNLHWTDDTNNSDGEEAMIVRLLLWISLNKWI